jgi:hypothetical protein
MKIDFPLSHGIELQISSETNLGTGYPTSRIQKGMVLICDGQSLVEEAVGFGVPILKRGLQTIFPGQVELYQYKSLPLNQVSACYSMNLVEKIARPDGETINNPQVYAGKNILAALIRNLPFMRGFLTRTSSLLRSMLDWKTTYELIDVFTFVTLSYTIDTVADRILVELIGQESILDSISEIIVMNEQGAHHFDQYQDSDGISEIGNKIGCWDQVSAASASFSSSGHQLAFGLPQANGARLYRGRELVGKRLAWSGFGYSFPPSLNHFSYEITIKRLP